jgi:hypothetical protein
MPFHPEGPAACLRLLSIEFRIERNRVRHLGIDLDIQGLKDMDRRLSCGSGRLIDGFDADLQPCAWPEWQWRFFVQYDALSIEMCVQRHHATIIHIVVRGTNDSTQLHRRQRHRG